MTLIALSSFVFIFPKKAPPSVDREVANQQEGPNMLAFYVQRGFFKEWKRSQEGRTPG